jgi:CelD/BcsL family acetyltransferase involved in cellulose biosynthesis
LLPLCRKRGYFARWRALGAREVFEPIDLLGSSPEGVSSIAESIARHPRPFQLDRIPADSALVPALRQAMRHRGWFSQRPATPCPTIALTGDWTQPETCFNARRRSDFRRAARRAAEFGEVTYEVISPLPEQFDALFDEAIGVEMCSWKQAAGTAIAADQAKETFFREFFRSACAQGNFRIVFLRIDGRAVAMQMAMEWRNRYWLFKIGYDEKFGKCSPGTLLMLHALGWAAGRNLCSFELLGNVEPWITELWTRERTACLCLRTYPFGIRGAAAFVADAIAWAFGRVTRRLA